MWQQCKPEVLAVVHAVSCSAAYLLGQHTMYISHLQFAQPTSTQTQQNTFLWHANRSNQK